MMLNVKEAADIIRNRLVGGKIQAVIKYQNLFIFQVFSDRPGEEEMDPFFSVDLKTGELLEFSILTDGDIDEITDLFLESKKTPYHLIEAKGVI